MGTPKYHLSCVQIMLAHGQREENGGPSLPPSLACLLCCHFVIVWWLTLKLTFQKSDLSKLMWLISWLYLVLELMKRRKLQAEAMGERILLFDSRGTLDWLKPPWNEPFRRFDPLRIISKLSRVKRLTVLEHSWGRERNKCDLMKTNNARVVPQAWMV